MLCFLVLPLIFAIITYAYILAFRQSLSQAAAEGVRAAAVAPTGTDLEQAAFDAVDAAMQDHGLKCNEGALTCVGTTMSDCATNGGDLAVSCYKVDVSYDYKDDPLLPTFGLGIVLPDTLSYSATAEVN